MTEVIYQQNTQELKTTNPTLFVFSIFDKKAQIFNTPFFSINHAVAIRSLSDLCADSRSSVSKHPDDFALYCLGGFDDRSGLVSGRIPEFVIEARSCVPPINE